MFDYVKDWIKTCSHCDITYKWCRRGSELLFSWPVITHFVILHVDLWFSDDFTDYAGSHYLLNCMCDLTQFVVVVPVPEMSSSIIAKYFMQEVLLNFGICHLIVMNDDTPFKELFTAACDSFQLKYE